MYVCIYYWSKGKNLTWVAKSIQYRAKKPLKSLNRTNGNFLSAPTVVILNQPTITIDLLDLLTYFTKILHTICLQRRWYHPCCFWKLKWNQSIILRQFLHISEKGILAITQILEATLNLQHGKNGRRTKLFILLKWWLFCHVFRQKSYGAKVLSNKDRPYKVIWITVIIQ